MKSLRPFALMLALVSLARTRAVAEVPLVIQNIQPTTNDGFAITWLTVPGRTDQLMYTDSLGGSWLPGPLHVAGSIQLTLCYTDYPPANVTQRFYRIKAQRRVVMSLVLDRSGSMNANGGAEALAPAVSHFIDLSDDDNDRASMVSFSTVATDDVPMRRPFKQDIKNAANALAFNGWTCAERGLTNALVENNSVAVPSGEIVLRVIVFFTDGMANTWYYTFNCGPRNISPDGQLWDPSAGASANAGCTVPATIPSIDGTNSVNTSDCVSLHYEAEKRAVAVASLARSQGNFIFAIGMGDPSAQGECAGVFPVLNSEFLKNIANTPDSATYNPSQPSGDYVIATDATELDQAFQTILQKLVLQSP